MQRITLSMLLGALGSLHCATAQDIQTQGGEASPAEGGAGGSAWASGGSPHSTGGTPQTGGTGAVASGGTGGTSTPAGSDCGSPDQKRCSGLCVSPAPSVGCSMTTCDPCPTVLNGVATCTGSQCDVTCNAGYVKSGTSCIASTSAGGTGGTTDPCADGLKNGFESDVDCGGSQCTKCSTGRACNSAADCTSGVCEQSCFLLIFCDPATCIAPACNDGVKNGSESDVDCGGSCSSRCADGRACNTGEDCQSGACQGGVCGQPQVCDGGSCVPEASVGDSGPLCEAGPDVCGL